MKTRYVFLLLISAAAAAALLPRDANGHVRVNASGDDRKTSRPRGSTAAQSGGVLGILRVDQGLNGRFDDAGTVVLLYSGQRNCQVAP